MTGSAAEPSEPAMRAILPDARGHRHAAPLTG
jgi:hypothetical protein